MKLTIDEFKNKKKELLNLKKEIDHESNINLKNNYLVMYSGLEDDLFSYDLSDIPYEELKDISFDNKIREEILFNDEKIEMNKYSKKDIIKNKDLFLINEDIPEDVKKDYFARSLSVEDFIKYQDVFKNIAIDNFLLNEVEIPLTVKENYKPGEYQKIILKYQDFFSELSRRRDLIIFNYFFKNEGNLEISTIKTAKKFIIDYLTNNHNFKFPKWAECLNFNFKTDITNTSDLLDYLDFDFLKNVQTEKFIQYFNVEYLKKLENDTKIFSKSNFKIFDIVKDYVLRNYDIIDFTKSFKTYDDFEKNFVSYLEKTREEKAYKDILDYTSVTSLLHDKYPLIFINNENSKELKTLFNEGNLNTITLYQKEEYIEELKNKDLFKVLDLPIIYLFNDYNFDFVKEYINTYGNYNFLKLWTSYGPFIKNGLNVRTLDDFYQFDKLNEKIEQSVYNFILTGKASLFNKNINYGTLEKNINFKNKYPEIFVDFKDVLNITEEENEHLKNLCYNGRLSLDYIKKYPELKEYLKHKKLFLFFQKNDNYNDFILSLGKDAFLTLGEKYGKLLEAISIEDIKKFKDYNNLEEKIMNVISQKCLSGDFIYEEDSKIFLKDKHKELFIDENAPKELKEYFYANDRYLDLKILKENYNEWKSYLTKNQIKLALLKNPSIHNDIKEYFNRFGIENGIKLALKSTDDVISMIDQVRIDKLEKWYKKTGETFIPNKTVMMKFPENDIDSFLLSGKYWSNLMRLKTYSNSEDKIISLIKASYLFGVFDQDSKGYDQLYSILTYIPKTISSNYSFILEELKKDINTKYKKDLILSLKKDKVEFDEDKLFERFYTEDENHNCSLNINFDYATKTSKVFRNILEQYEELPIITPNKLEKIFKDFLYENNPGFREFFLKNLNIILNNNNEKLEMLNKVAKSFREIEIMNSNRKLTLNHALSYISSASYQDINVGNEALARTSLIAGYKEKDFEVLQQIYNLGRKRTLSSIARVENSHNDYDYEILRLDDPFALTVGVFSDCCQKLSGRGETCMEHSMIDNDGRIFVVKDKVGHLVAESWVWRNGDTLCFDNIEVPNKAINREVNKTKEALNKEIFEVYKKAAEELIKLDKETYQKLLEEKKITKEEYEALRLKKITIGRGNNDIYKVLEENLTLEKEYNIKEPIKYEPVILNRKLDLDDSKNQYVLLDEKTVDKEYNLDNLYIYNDEYIEYNDSNFKSFNTYQELENITKNTNYKVEESNLFITKLAIKHNLNPQTTKVVMNPNFAILYDSDDKTVKIADLLFNKKIINKNQIIDIEDSVLLQINMAINQIKKDKDIMLLSLNDEQINMFNKALEIKKDIRRK